MNILITGGAGFVGSNLALLLKAKYPSYHITVLDNLKRRGSELNVPRLSLNNIHFSHGDIRNKEDLKFSTKFDLIIDASAEPSVQAGLDGNTYPLISHNLIGTINCLELAAETGAAFLFLSTSRVYPIKTIEKACFTETSTRYVWSNTQTVPGISEKGISEDFPLQGSRSLYGATKLAAELLIEEYRVFRNIKTVINRCGVLTGPWQMGKLDQGVVVLWMARHFWNKELSYIGYGGTGKQVRDILHINDFFRLVDWQIHNLKIVDGETFNVGGGINSSCSLLELTELCQEISGSQIKIISVAENRSADLRIYITDNSKIHQSSGWQPEFQIKDTLKDVYAWIKSNADTLKTILN